MLRFRLGLLFCAALVLSFVVSAHAADLGKVLFVRFAGDPENGPADVYEKNLNTDATKLLISHKSLPKSFQTRIDSVNPSPDGRFVVLNESPGWIIRDGKTGKSRVMFGYGFSYSGDEELSGEIGGGRWCWERKTGAVKQIRKGVGLEHVGMAWSPKGDYLLITETTDGSFNTDSAPEGSIQIYNPVSGKSIHFNSINNLGIAEWSGKGDGVIEVTYSSKSISTVLFQPITGKRKMLFSWPRPISNIAQSPDGTTFAIFDDKGYYLTNSKGKNIKTLRIPRQEECFSVNLCFNRSGSHLAISTYYCFGEPHINETDQLWSVDVKKASVKRIVEWNECLQGSGTAVNRSVIGWLPDDKSIAVEGSICYGEEMPAEMRNNWSILWRYNMLTPTGKGQKLFDSDKGCLGIGYCPGK